MEEETQLLLDPILFLAQLFQRVAAEAAAVVQLLLHLQEDLVEVLLQEEVLVPELAQEMQEGILLQKVILVAAREEMPLPAAEVLEVLVGELQAQETKMEVQEDVD